MRRAAAARRRTSKFSCSVARRDESCRACGSAFSGSLEPGETITGGALRELREETGIGPAHIAAFYDLDQVNQFHEPSVGAVLTGVIFAVLLRPAVEPILSFEHDEMRWVSPLEALELAVWPAYRESIRRIVENLGDDDRASWFELTLGGARVRQ